MQPAEVCQNAEAVSLYKTDRLTIALDQAQIALFVIDIQEFLPMS